MSRVSQGGIGSNFHQKLTRLLILPDTPIKQDLWVSTPRGPVHAALARLFLGRLRSASAALDAFVHGFELGEFFELLEAWAALVVTDAVA